MVSRIEDYALIGNTRTVALVGRDGSIDWLCLPRLDSSACFAALLGKRENGRWTIHPAEKPRAVERRYRGETLVLETAFETDSGRVTIIDFMPLPAGGGPARIVRLVRGERGTVPMRLEAAFRFDYGRVVPWVRRTDHGLRAIAGPEAIRLFTPLPLRGRDKTTIAEFTVSAGQTIPCTLTWTPSHLPEHTAPDPLRDLAETEAFWSDWSGRCNASGEYRDAVIRSLITLKALTYSPTGGIAAAATTSLPEQLGGVRNWDYRYCWLRDTTFTLYALLISGYQDEARAWREWLLRAVAGEPSKLQIMYGLAGERRLSEYELPWLSGYAGSRPVRVGNAAHTQSQLDVYGEVMDAFHCAHGHGIQTDDDAWRVQSVLLNYLEGHWQDTDSGIWEARGAARRYTYSSVMTWVAFDRAVKAVERFGQRGPAERWRALRQKMHDEICAQGFDTARNSFAQYFGGKSLDASLLLMPLVGFLPASDPRIQGTVEAVQRDLVSDGLVLRYVAEGDADGLPPGEGTFLACSFWLADNLALMGRDEEARVLFERLLSLRNDVGLLAEEYDPRARRQLGNFPQAFSHVGVINTAHNLMLRRGPAERRAKH
jgi:GH15 family glucan-1,4-alpha-glucosidase